LSAFYSSVLPNTARSCVLPAQLPTSAAAESIMLQQTSLGTQVHLCSTRASADEQLQGWLPLLLLSSQGRMDPFAVPGANQQAPYWSKYLAADVANAGVHRMQLSPRIYAALE
jgi:hypothetical protein